MVNPARDFERAAIAMRLQVEQRWGVVMQQVLQHDPTMNILKELAERLNESCIEEIGTPSVCATEEPEMFIYLCLFGVAGFEVRARVARMAADNVKGLS